NHCRSMLVRGVILSLLASSCGKAGPLQDSQESTGGSISVPPIPRGEFLVTLDSGEQFFGDASLSISVNDAQVGFQVRNERGSCGAILMSTPATLLHNPWTAVLSNQPVGLRGGVLGLGRANVESGTLVGSIANAATFSGVFTTTSSDAPSGRFAGQIA